MNKVPKLRFKEFSGEWEEKKFKELVLLQRGSSPRPIVKFITTSQDGVNWIKIGDTNKESQFITSTSEKITKEGAKKSREVKKGEIILSNSMSFGRPFILKIDGYIHDGWFVLRNYEKNFNKEFLCQLLGSEIVQKQYKKLAAGGVVENISSELVNSVDINLPTIKEQQKIADFLSNIDKKISITEEKLDLFKDYKKGIMQKIFNQELRFKDSKGNDYPKWEEKRLGDITTNISSGKTLIKLETGSFNLYGSTGKIGFTNVVDYCGENILIARVGANAGTLNFINEECGITDNTLVTSVKNNNSNKWLYYYLISYNLNRLIFGSGQPLITGSLLKKICLNVPCLEEQQKIANFLSSIDNKIDTLTTELKNLKEFKKGLLQQMFV